MKNGGQQKCIDKAMLALLFIHWETDLDVSEIIDLFTQKNRRIQLK